MNMSLEYGLMVLLALIVVYAMYYYFFRKSKCTLSTDCKTNQVCSGGYCVNKGGS
jgi:uncharacterized membrane protein YukC